MQEKRQPEIMRDRNGAVHPCWRGHLLAPTPQILSRFPDFRTDSCDTAPIYFHPSEGRGAGVGWRRLGPGGPEVCF